MTFTRNTTAPGAPPSGDAARSDVPQRHHLDRRAGDLITEAKDEDGDELLATSEVAEWIGISTQWLEIARSCGFGPKFVRLSARRVRYLRASVLDWLREREHQHTAEYCNRKEKEKASA